MGVNLVQTKLLAYMLGGGFAGLAGAISAGLVGSIFASSIQLQLSINVVAIVIVGGMGSIPGVIVGAAALVGLPELLREFAEYRLLVYGAVLVAMMLLKPEGLWPEATHQRELHEEESDAGGADVPETAVSRG
jgi:branched-chain amino acid transport system permease protein